MGERQAVRPHAPGAVLRPFETGGAVFEGTVGGGRQDVSVT